MRTEVMGFDSLVRKFSSEISDMDKTIKMALGEGGEILTRQTKDEIRRAANRGYATGELARSVSPTVPRKNSWGYFVAVRPTGSDPRGIRNGEKWGYLQHGNGRGSEPRDFQGKAVRNSEKEIAKRAQSVFERRSRLN